jgi:hypothetical protein
MDWIRENKPLAAILGVIIAGSLALGYLLFGAWSSYSEAKENFLAQGTQVAALKSARLSPSDANLQAKRALVEEYAANVNRLGGALLILQPPVLPIKDIEFQTKLKAKIAEARQSATNSKLSLPAEFAFGFDEYTSSLPKAEAAAELSNYLDAMVELVKLFMLCGVQSLDVLERSKLPMEQESAVASPQQRAIRPGARQPTMAMAMAAPSIYESRRVSIILTLDQGPLQLLVSRLANPSDMPFFTSLKVLRIENEMQEGPIRSDISVPQAEVPTAEGAAVTPAASTPSNEIKAPPPAPVDSIPVIGRERLKVRMEIDLLKFLDAARGVAAQQSAPGR